MIKHIVMWKLKDFAEGKSKAENAVWIKRELEELTGKIPEIVRAEVGININGSVQAYDAVLYSEFAGLEELNRYQEHPEHKKVSAYIGKIRDGRTVVDYEA